MQGSRVKPPGAVALWRDRAWLYHRYHTPHLQHSCTNWYLHTTRMGTRKSGKTGNRKRDPITGRFLTVPSGKAASSKNSRNSQKNVNRPAGTGGSANVQSQPMEGPPRTNNVSANSSIVAITREHYENHILCEFVFKSKL
jgi:hypothetical protein